MPLARTIMIQGTASHVGKSVVTAAVCSWLRRQGYRVAPFKALNMALNSAVTPDGREISRSVAFQAEVCGIEPCAQMNPVLLKPTSGRGSQVIALGEAQGYRTAGDRTGFLEWALPIVSASLAWLRERHDIVVMEGAGSPAEVNLRDTDVANMRAADLGDAPVLLVGDIDRGGIFAALYGTVALLPPEHRRRVMGLIVNKFRGSSDLFQAGVRSLEELCGVPVLGVLPYRYDLAVPEEDGVALEPRNAPPEDSGSVPDRQVDIVVIHLPHISNFTDFGVLSADPDLAVRYVQRPTEWASPDLVIVPGTKSTVSDLAWLREQGLADLLLEHARGGKRIIGLCGGYQMLGRHIYDPDVVEGEWEMAAGLGLLSIDTVFDPSKTVRRVSGRGIGGWLEGVDIAGYEIHHGRQELLEGTQPLLELSNSVGSRFDGAIDETGRISGCYVHGVFDTPAVHGALRSFLGLAREPSPRHSQTGTLPAEPYQHLAEWLERNLDTTQLLRIILDR